MKTALVSILEEREWSPFDSARDLYRRTAVARDALGNLVRGGFLDASPHLQRRRAGRAALGRTHAPRQTLRTAKAWPKPGGTAPPGTAQGQEGVPRDSGSGLHPDLGRTEGEDGVGGLEPQRLPTPPRSLPDGTPGVKRLLQCVEPGAESHGKHLRVAGLLESLQRPPTKSGRPVYFLLIEDERGLLQCTIFSKTYDKYGHVLHHSGAFLLEGQV